MCAVVRSSARTRSTKSCGAPSRRSGRPKSLAAADGQISAELPVAAKRDPAEIAALTPDWAVDARLLSATICVASDPGASSFVAPPIRIAAATAGDHPAIHQLLQTVLQGPSRQAFAASLDDPFYEPQHRIVAKRGQQIVGHVHALKRVLRFESLHAPVDLVTQLAVLPEHRGQGLGTRLLASVEQKLQRDGSVLGLLVTRCPKFFARHGWAVCGRHSEARVGVRELLAQLSARGLLRPQRRLNIRPWRHIELPALLRLYDQQAGFVAGHLERTETYWRWLMTRKGFDRVFVAIDGPDKLDFESAAAPIVGYLMAREDRILELAAAPGHPTAAAELLARACGEAIERDYQTIALSAPPTDPLFELFEQANAERLLHESRQGEVYMVKAFDLLGLLRSLGPLVLRRAIAANLSRPCALGLHVDGQKHRLLVTRRSVKVDGGRLGRSYLTCSRAELTRLVLGHCTPREAAAQGRLSASTQWAFAMGDIVFPRLPVWRPPLEDL